MVMSLKHRKRQIFKGLVMGNHTHSWWHNITPLTIDATIEAFSVKIKELVARPTSQRHPLGPIILNTEQDLESPAVCCLSPT